MDDKVTNIAEKARDSTMWSMDQMIACALDDITKKGISKAFVISLDDADGGYIVHYHNKGMRASEMIAAIECIKAKLLSEMGHIRDAELREVL